MRASRFSIPDPDEGDPQPGTADRVARKLLDSCNSLSISIDRRSDGRLLVDFDMRGSFGDAEEEGECPTLASGDARTMVGDLLATFIEGR